MILRIISTLSLVFSFIVFQYLLLPSRVFAVTNSYQISGSRDDVNEDGSDFSSNLPAIWLGNGSGVGESYAGLRFTGVDVPQGARITAATLSVYNQDQQWINIDFGIFGDMVANSVIFTRTNRPSSRILTSAHITHQDNVLWDANSWNDLEDVSPVIQEIVDQQGWNSENSVSLILKGNGSQWGRKFITSYDGSPQNAPKLTISYELATSNARPINTMDGGNAGLDALNYSAGRVWTIDKYGNYILITQNVNSDHHWTWSNDSGTTWIQGTETTPFVVRGSVAYSSIDDKLNVIWEGSNNSDGIIYRRYGITRDSNNHIIDIVREDAGSINTQLDFGSTGSLVGPSATWFDDGSAHGILITSWSRIDTGLAEVRSSMLPLTNTWADGDPANWVAPSGAEDVFIGAIPQVASNRLFSDMSGNVYSTLVVRGGTGLRKNDLYVFVATNTISSQEVLAYRAIYDNTGHNWSGGWQTPITVGSMEVGTGYGSKWTLITKPVLDTGNDRLYIGWPRWKDAINGDTASFAYLDAVDIPSQTFDVYSALGPHAYAPTLDIAFDEQQGLLYLAYIESTTNGTNGSVDYVSFDGTAISAPVRFYTSPGGAGGADGGADIPQLFDNRHNNQLLITFRVNGAIPATPSNPNSIVFGTIPLQ
jgi:hypothetical protein